MSENFPFPQSNANSEGSATSGDSSRGGGRRFAHAPTNNRRRWPLVLLWTVVAVILIGGGAAAWYGFTLNNSFNKAEKIAPEEIFPEETDRPAEVERPEGASDDAQNILLLGSDTRGEVGDDLEDIRGQRSDTIMVVHIPADRDNVQVMSIMRDNWVEIPGHGMNKINAAMSLGGVPLLVQTVEGIIDVRIDHVAIVDFEGFKGMTDALGGVTINNPRAFSSRGATFPEGEITLNGEDALKFVRDRYSFADGDYTRVANQQLYIKGVVSKLMSRDTLTSPGKIADVVDEIAPYLTIDAGMDTGYIAKLGLSMRDVRGDNISFFTSPTLGTGREGAQSVVRPDWDELAIVAEHFRTDTLDEYAE